MCHLLQEMSTVLPEPDIPTSPTQPTEGMPLKKRTIADIESREPSPGVRNRSRTDASASSSPATKRTLIGVSPYRDHSHILPNLNDKRLSSHCRPPTFVVALHRMLSNPAVEDVICWLPHGRAWRIINKEAFERIVLPLYFRHCYSSFMRQVSGWGFRRVSGGPDYGAYYHEMFLRGMPHLCIRMRRQVTKSNGLKGRKPKVDEFSPDFYKLSEDHPLPQALPIRGFVSPQSPPNPLSPLSPCLGLLAALQPEPQTDGAHSDLTGRWASPLSCVGSKGLVTQYPQEPPLHHISNLDTIVRLPSLGRPQLAWQHHLDCLPAVNGSSFSLASSQKDQSMMIPPLTLSYVGDNSNVGSPALYQDNHTALHRLMGIRELMAATENGLRMAAKTIASSK